MNKLLKVLLNIITGRLHSQIKPTFDSSTRNPAVEVSKRIRKQSDRLQECRIKWARLPILHLGDAEGKLSIVELHRDKWVTYFPGVRILYLGISSDGSRSEALLKGEGIIPKHLNPEHGQEIRVLSGIVRLVEEDMTLESGDSFSFSLDDPREFILDGVLYTSWIPSLPTCH